MGNDEAFFEIVDGLAGKELHLKQGVTLESETNPVLDVTVNADDDGLAPAEASAALSLQVTDVDTPPVVLAEIADQAATEDAAFTFAIPAGTFADDKGEEALTLTATLDDDTPLPGWLVFDAATGIFSGTPSQADLDLAPTLSVKVTAADALGAAVSDTFTLDITEVDDAPVAGDDAGATFKNLPVTFTVADLLANDTDEEGQPLTITGVSNAQNGTVSLDGGVVTFAPASNFSGQASFDYTLSDGGQTDTGTVTIEVSDAAPVTITPVAITTAALSSYDRQDAQPTAFSVQDNALSITGNSWKALALPDGGTLITDGTKLRFTFKTTDEGEINAIGLETNNNHTGSAPSQLFFGLKGSQLPVWGQIDRQG